MDKDVLITIGGTMSAGESEDNVDVVMPGQYYWRNERHFLIYEEVMEEFTEPTSNMIRISPQEISVRKKGVINSEMIFRPEEETVTEYVTPYGTMVMGVYTNRIRIQETDQRISVLIQYVLRMDGQEVSNNYIRIVVQPRRGEFSLR